VANLDTEKLLYGKEVDLSKGGARYCFRGEKKYKSVAGLSPFRAGLAQLDHESKRVTMLVPRDLGKLECRRQKSC